LIFFIFPWGVKALISLNTTVVSGDTKSGSPLGAILQMSRTAKAWIHKRFRGRS